MTDHFYFGHFRTEVSYGQLKPEDIHGYFRGLMVGFWCFSYIREGQILVGTRGKTYQSARLDAFEEYIKTCNFYIISPSVTREEIE